MKKVLRFFIIFLLSGILLAGAGCFALSIYYKNNFPVNTWINGVYCTGKTVNQVNEELIDAQEASSILIVDADGIFWEVNMQEAGILPDYTEQLNSYLQKKATFFWMNNLGNTVSQEFVPECYVLEEEKFRNAFMQIPFVTDECERAQGVEVVWTENGYCMQDGNRQRLNIDNAVSAVKDGLEKGNTVIFLKESGCYEDFPDGEEDRRQRVLWERICAYTDRSSRLTYDMGSEKIVFTPDISSRFLKREEGGCPVLDAEGKLVIEEEQVQEWVEQLKEIYDTGGTEREFKTTRGSVITVKYDTYGTELDGTAEQAFLLETLECAAAQEDDIDGTAVMHVPVYLRQGFVRGMDDIGGTYIEIDMTDQRMYYYVEGELVLETDVVTGDTGKGMGTPSGITYVYNMERNRTLRGTGYTSFVKYWMPIKGGVGIHDASWRRTFGGEIYKTDGSHGCINTPTDVMGELFEMAETGTPVITFY